MFPVGSFDRMMNELYCRESDKGTDMPITVAILIADFRRQYARENIFNYLDYYDKKSGPLFDFYIPGYCLIDEIREPETYNFKESNYAFSSKLYDEFIKKLESYRIKVQLQTEIIIIEYEKGCLDFSHCLHCNLEACQSEGKIESAKQFLDALIEISKKTVEYKEFKLQIKTKSIVRFIKHDLTKVLTGTVLKIFPMQFGK